MRKSLARGFNRFNNKLVLAAAVAAVAGLSAVPAAHAAVVRLSSTATASTIWGTATNWDGGVAPTATDDVIFDYANTSTPTVVGLNGTQAANSLQFGSSTGPALGAFTLRANTTGTTARTLNFGTSGQSGAGSITVDSSVTGTQTIGTTANGTLTIKLATGVSAFNITNNSSTQILDIVAVLGQTDTGSSINLTSSGGLIKLRGANTVTGTTTISAGTVQLGSATGLGTAAVKLAFASASTGKLQLFGNNVTVAGLNTDATTPGTPIIESGSATGGTDVLTVNTTIANTYAGVLQDGVAGRLLGLTKSGTGSLALTGTNTFTGAISLSGGILSAATANINGSDATNGITFNGGTLQASGDISTAKGITMTGNGIIDSNGNNVTLSGNISGAGTLTKNSSGSLTLSGSNGSHSGATTLSAGTLNLNSTNALGTGQFNLNGGVFDASSGNIVMATNNIIVIGGDVAFTGTNDLTFGTGAVKYGANRTINLGRDLTFGGILQQTDDGNAHTLTINGSGFTFTVAGWDLDSGGTKGLNETIAGDATVLIRAM